MPLQEFDATVVYKSGRKHEDADTLSRAPTHVVSEGAEDDDGFLGAISSSDLSSRQRDDAEIRPIIDHLEGHGTAIPRHLSCSLTSFCLRDGVLYKNARTNERTYLLMVPRDMRDDVLFACHDEPTSGHLGFSRTLAKVSERYYWSGLSASVKQYVKGCRECQRRKKPSVKPAALLQPTEATCMPFDQAGMDILGPFPLSADGNKWVIIATDYLTPYAETQAIPRATASEVAQFFMRHLVVSRCSVQCNNRQRGSIHGAAYGGGS